MIVKYYIRNYLLGGGIFGGIGGIGGVLGGMLGILGMVEGGGIVMIVGGMIEVIVGGVIEVVGIGGVFVNSWWGLSVWVRGFCVVNRRFGKRRKNKGVKCGK